MKKILILVLLAAACSRNPSPGGQLTGAAAPRLAAEMFMRAVAAQDLQAMSVVWGTEKGAARDQLDRNELDKRLIMIQSCYAHDRFDVLDETPGPSGHRFVLVVGARPVELRVVSNRRPSLPGVPHTWREWSLQTETDELAGFDVGIMPMPDDDWARGKCAFKAFQCMAMGVATAASAVGANLEVTAHGRNGLLAGSTDEWLACVTSLVDNPDRRHQLGMAGRRTVEERYSMKESAAKFEHVIREVVGRRKEHP